MESTRDLGCAELWAKSLEQSLARRGRPRRASVELYRLKPERDLASARPLAESSAYWHIRRTAAERAAMPLTSAGSGAALALLAATTLPSLLGGGRAAGATIHAKALEPARAPGKLGAAIARALITARHHTPASQVSAPPRGEAAAASHTAGTARHTAVAAAHTAVAAAHTAVAAAHTAGMVTARAATASHTAGMVTAHSATAATHPAAPAPATHGTATPAAPRAVVAASAAPVHANFAAAPDSGGAPIAAGPTARTAAPSTRTAAPSTRTAASSSHAGARTPHPATRTKSVATHHATEAAGASASATGTTHRAAAMSSATGGASTIAPTAGRVRATPRTRTPARATPRTLAPTTPRTHRATTHPAASGLTGVQALQQRLGVTIDGDFGPMTKAAVERFQRAHGLTPNGIVGPGTRAALGLGPGPVLSEVGSAPAPAPARTTTSSATTAPTGGTSLASSSPSTGASAQIAAMVAAGNAIATRPYVYGGGHGSFDSYGYDCSGSVSYVLHAAGLLSSPEDSTGLESYGAPGPGRYVTIYANAGHAFMTIDGRRFDTIALQETGTRWSSTPGSTSGYVVRHPVGL